MMQRVLIIGSPGSGKSTLAQQLASRTKLPLIHLDQHYWRAGWTPPSQAQWDAQIQQLLQAPRWIMDGHYGRTLPQRLAAADTVIWLDLPTWPCLWRVLQRSLISSFLSRTDMATGCPERLDLSFLKRVWRFRREQFPATQQAVINAQSQGCTVHILRTPREIQRWLEM